MDSRESLNRRYRKSTTIPISNTATAAPIRTPVSYKTQLRCKNQALSEGKEVMSSPPDGRNSVLNKLWLVVVTDGCHAG